MVVFRLASRRHPPDSSEGARLYGGRWNLIGILVIYASSTRSLAALEVIVHHSAIPADYQVIVIDIPDTLPIETIELQDLPEGWPATQSADTAAHGSKWAASLRTAVLRVPSAAIRGEYNYIVNPLHKDFLMIRFNVPGAEYIDLRLRK